MEGISLDELCKRGAALSGKVVRVIVFNGQVAPLTLQSLTHLQLVGGFIGIATPAGTFETINFSPFNRVFGKDSLNLKPSKCGYRGFNICLN